MFASLSFGLGAGWAYHALASRNAGIGESPRLVERRDDDGIRTIGPTVLIESHHDPLVAVQLDASVVPLPLP